MSHRYIVGRSVESRPLDCIVIGRGSDVTFILATIHGNEQIGTPLVHRLTQHLQQHSCLLNGRKVIILPIANPDGIARNKRTNSRGVDLNRNFPASNRLNNARFGSAALTEPESRIIDRLIWQYHPNRIVSIHQPLACIDYDGPALDLARHMAEYCPLPIRKLGAKPGSLGSYAGETLNIPIITLELKRSDDSLDPDTLWRRYGKTLLAAIAFPDKIR